MKEQDAAHSFTEGMKVPKEKSMLWQKEEHYQTMEAELTRLRYELQQKDEKIKECIKTIMKLEDDVNYLKIEELSPLRSELQQAKEEIESLRDQINQ